jgi:hypothetical protein
MHMHACPLHNQGKCPANVQLSMYRKEEHSCLLLFLLLGSATLSHVAAAQAVVGTRQLVPPSSSSSYPFNAVGQLANGCTGFLIGPCHVMTVAHCVVEPWKKIWWGGLDFYPGRCASVATDAHCIWCVCEACCCYDGCSCSWRQCIKAAAVWHHAVLQQ